MLLYKRFSQQSSRVWEGNEPMIGAVKRLEWSPAGGLRHASWSLPSER